ncbi:MAG: SH3 domain-containing protein [Bacteroidaceae bacterium]|nr:SH3 domain-containing protein [Bacteroidaceae bacterium]
MRENVLRYIVLCCFAVVCCCAMAAAHYRVNCGSLNFRQKASGTSKVLLKVRKGEEMEVFEIQGKWARVRYGEHEGYVIAKYIEETDGAEELAGLVGPDGGEVVCDTVNKSNNRLFFGFDLSPEHKTTDKHWFWLAFVLSMVTMLLYFFDVRSEETVLLRNKFGFGVVALAFLGTCVSQITYYLTYNGDATWFCSPYVVGWGWTVGGFSLYGLVMYSQVAMLVRLINTFHRFGGRDESFQWGLAGIGVSIIAMVACSLFFKEFAYLIMLVLLATQLLQLVLWAIATHRERRWLNLFFLVVFYVVSTVCTFVTLIYFLNLLLFVLLGFTLLSFMWTSWEAKCANCMYYQDGYCNKRQRIIYSTACCRGHKRIN